MRHSPSSSTIPFAGRWISANCGSSPSPRRRAGRRSECADARRGRCKRDRFSAGTAWCFRPARQSRLSTSYIRRCRPFCPRTRSRIALKALVRLPTCRHLLSSQKSLNPTSGRSRRWQKWPTSKRNSEAINTRGMRWPISSTCSSFADCSAKVRYNAGLTARCLLGAARNKIRDGATLRDISRFTTQTSRTRPDFRGLPRTSRLRSVVLMPFCSSLRSTTGRCRAG